jgi:hypothetical protein
MIASIKTIPPVSHFDSKILEFITLRNFSVIVTVTSFKNLSIRCRANFALLRMPSFSLNTWKMIFGKVAEAYDIPPELWL